MSSNDHHDRLVDLLLWELVGEERPPDVRARVLEAASRLPHARAVLKKPTLHSLATSPARRSQAPAFAMAAILTLIGVAGALIHLQRISVARTPALTAVTGTVNHPVGNIPLGESLSTGSESSAELTYQDGTVVELSAETTIVLTKRSPWDRSKDLEIVDGRVHAEVAPQLPGKPFVLGTGDAWAEVVGTKLSFDRNESRTRLEVTKGAVRFIPRKAGREVLVETGYFAEAGKSGFRHEKIPVPGIIRFTLMNADTDQPLRNEPLANGETIPLSALPTPNINIRADFEGDAPLSVRINVTRADGKTTGMRTFASEDQVHPPFFAAGDYWADGRPDDCRAWTPRPGLYHISAEAFYPPGVEKIHARPLEMNFRITR